MSGMKKTKEIMSRAQRILKSEAARKRRKKVKELREYLEQRLYARLRRKKKNK